MGLTAASRHAGSINLRLLVRAPADRRSSRHCTQGTGRELAARGNYNRALEAGTARNTSVTDAQSVSLESRNSRVAGEMPGVLWAVRIVESTSPSHWRLSYTLTSR